MILIIVSSYSTELLPLPGLFKENVFSITNNQ